MSQIDYYNNFDPSYALPHRSGIKGWGMLLIVLGVLSLCAIGLEIVGLVLTNVFAPNSAAKLPAAVLIGGAANLAITGSILIWLGIGSRSVRRWSRSLLVAGSIVYLVHGLLAVPAVFETILIVSQRKTTSPVGAAPISPIIRMIGAVVGATFGLSLALVLPALLLWFYGRSSVRADFERFDVTPVWTDRCPLPVLVYCIQAATSILQIIAVAPTGTATIFSMIYTGIPAYIVFATLAVWLFAAAYLCYRLNLLGWTLALAMTAYSAVSNIIFILHGDAPKLLDQMHTTSTAFPQADALRLMREGLVWQTAFHIIVIVYLFWLLRYFKPQSPLTTTTATAAI